MVLADKVAFVTGATSGIGLGIAKVFARNKAKLILCGLEDKSEVSGILSDLSNISSNKVEYFSLDLASKTSIAETFTNIQKEFGGVDILVNNAGMQYVAPVDEMPEDKWDLILSVNLSAIFHTVRHALPYMKQKGWGRIINVASTHGLVASVNKAPYVAAKHGVVGFTKVVALETAELDITCNAICPGWVRTPLVEKQIQARASAQGISIHDAAIDLLAEKQPSLKFVEPEQVGEYALFLCSEAASQITGAALTMDGGWTIR
jgi:3-hydroxybutyrate dehydrogenase